MRPTPEARPRISSEISLSNSSGYETGPIAWYTQHGYAYEQMDVRGTGHSSGEYHFLDKKEQHDYYEVVEWIAKQPWSTGKVCGVGQSYYAMAQWLMAEQNPPHLACIAPYDGYIDSYHNSAYQGGIPMAARLLDHADNWRDRKISRRSLNGNKLRQYCEDELRCLSFIGNAIIGIVKPRVHEALCSSIAGDELY